MARKLLEPGPYDGHHSVIISTPPMNDMLYISRSFVEFGPFSPAEIQAFYQRGMLKDTDYVRHTSGNDWIHVNDWAASAPAPAPAASDAPAKTAKKAAAPKAKAAADTAPGTKAPRKAKK